MRGHLDHVIKSIPDPRLCCFDARLALGLFAHTADPRTYDRIVHHACSQQQPSKQKAAFPNIVATDGLFVLNEFSSPHHANQMTTAGSGTSESTAIFQVLAAAPGHPHDAGPTTVCKLPWRIKPFPDVFSSPMPQ
jgi:hypothetical protein